MHVVKTGLRWFHGHWFSVGAVPVSTGKSKFVLSLHLSFTLCLPSQFLTWPVISSLITNRLTLVSSVTSPLLVGNRSIYLGVPALSVSSSFVYWMDILGLQPGIEPPFLSLCLACAICSPSRRSSVRVLASVYVLLLALVHVGVDTCKRVQI